MNQNIAIIGGGLSGLFALKHLIDQGYQNVVLFEKASKIGGNAETIQYNHKNYDLGTMFIPEAAEHMVPDEMMNQFTVPMNRYFVELDGSKHIVPSFLNKNLEYSLKQHIQHYTRAYLGGMENLENCIIIDYWGKNEFNYMFCNQQQLYWRNENGFYSFIETIFEKYMDKIRVNTGVRNVQFVSEQWKVSFENGSVRHFDYVIFAVPAHCLQEMIYSNLPLYSVLDDVKADQYVSTCLLKVKDTRNIMDETCIYNFNVDHTLENSMVLYKQFLNDDVVLLGFYTTEDQHDTIHQRFESICSALHQLYDIQVVEQITDMKTIRFPIKSEKIMLWFKNYETNPLPNALVLNDFTHGGSFYSIIHKVPEFIKSKL